MKVFELKNKDGIITERFEGREEDGKIIKDGRYEKWYDSGIKKCEGEFLENSKFGIWTYYYPDGNIYKRGEFVQDIEVGEWEQFTQRAPEPILPAPVPETHSEKVLDDTVTSNKPIRKRKTDRSVNKDTLSAKKINEKKPVLFVRSDKLDDIDDLEDESFFKRLDNSNPWYLVIAVLSIILIVLVMTVVVPDSQGNQISAGNNDVSGKAPVDTASIVRTKFNDWVNYTNTKNITALMDMYADEVNYYRWGQTSKENVKNDKWSFFKKYNVVTITVDNVNIQVENKVRYACTYNKTYSLLNLNGNSESGKVKSRLVFMVVNGELKIVAEKDDKPVR